MTKPINELVTRVMTEMPAPTQHPKPEQPTPTSVLSPKTTSAKRFETGKVQVLVKMRKLADDFMRAMMYATTGADVAPYWLTFTGGCGNGKTMLAREIYRCQQAALRTGPWRTERPGFLSCVQDGCWCSWSAYAAEIGTFDFSRRERILSAWFAVLDDIGSDSRDARVKAELFRILDGRLGKWTVITCNLKPDAICEQLDERIASRLIRDGNVLLQNTAPDWAMKGK